jgi:hypothetical protein
MFTKIVSGGQTGVDRAALDVALSLGLPCGGWCPRGRRAEDGPIAPHYPLTETTSPAYPHRTRLNVRDSDGTLILTRGKPDGGTALTIQLAKKMTKPFLVVDLAKQADVSKVRAWVREQRLEVLNVAGPRESEKRGIYAEAVRCLRELFGGSDPLPLLPPPA